MKIGFLFNHDATHQIAHTAPVAAALAARGVDVEILASNPEQRAAAEALLPTLPGGHFTTLPLSAASRAADRVLRAVAPFRRVAILRENLAIFRALDALVVPETTSSLLRTRFGLTTPKLIYLPHGAGDGAAGFQPATKAFDLVLLSGPKIRDRMLQAGLVTADNSVIVGYPKFDTVDLARRPDFFGNGRPTVLYNPHFNPVLSSWYTLGEQVLDWFAAQDRFNLIFAPHVMLFRRRLHISPIYRAWRLRRPLPGRYLHHPGLLIDTGSARSTDMSYALAADIYLGDVSSQIYEWIARPRPAIFLNTHMTQWQNKLEYRHWALGDVITDVAALPACLDRALADPHAHASRQSAAFAETFSVTDRPASARAAGAILAFMAQVG